MTWVCIIDDDPQVADVLTSALRAAGYGVRSFVHGLDALTAIDESIEAPRLVVLDMLLPTPGGHEVLRRLRSSPTGAEVPVIVVTGLDDITEQSFAPGTVSAVLRKPVAIDVLLAKIAGLVRAAG
jgi:two-component system OmpR family response regulator